MFWPDLSSFFRPRFDWLQVEVTSHCNASCTYCPRTVYHDRWASRHLSLEIFRKLVSAFARTRLVFLSGWGEPFLNPDLWAMIQMVKEAGCRVGTTTNGMLLDPEKIRWLVELEVDVVAFSLAGADAYHDAVRQGTRLRQVLGAMADLNLEKERQGRAKPEIHVAYMLLRSGREELARLPQVLEGVGVSQVVLSTLDFVASRELQEETICPATLKEYVQLKAQMEEVAEKGRPLGLSIHHQLFPPGARRRTCTENVPRALVVAADGQVSPCVYTNLPVSGVTYLAGGRERPYQRLTFGNVKEQAMPDIWRHKAYRHFRRSLATGRLAAPCQQCPKL